MQATLPQNSRLIFKGITGSHSYGLAMETSDIDYAGVFIQDEADILSNNYVEMVQVNADEKYFELRKFLELLSVANPNALELLYLPEDCIVTCEPEFYFLMHIRDQFLTKRCGATFSGYAKTQLRKSKGLGKKLNWEKHKTERKGVIDFCKYFERSTGRVYPMKEAKTLYCKYDVDEVEFGLSSVDGFRDTYRVYVGTHPKLRGITSGDKANDVSLSEIPKEMNNQFMGLLYFNREAYSTHCKDYAEYIKWLAARNENRYVTNKAHGQTYDGKNILHTVRLIMTAENIAKNGTLDINMENNRDFLLSIKKGSVSLFKVIEEWSGRALKIDELFAASKLPDSLPENFITELELKLRKL